MRKYLKNIEDVEALRNTDTKIYYEGCSCYMKFVNGVLCAFYKDGDIRYNTNILLNQYDLYYIEVDEHDCVRQDAEDEPSEDLIGKLGWFWDSHKEYRIMDRLEDVNDGVFKGLDAGEWFGRFCPLTPEEVEEYTGYKVVKED